MKTSENHDCGVCVPVVSVKVFVPSQVHERPFTWQQSKTVGDAAKEVATDFCIDTEAPTFQKGRAVLRREDSLSAAGVKDCDELELVSAGGGV